MAITIQYTDEGDEKIIGSDGQVSEDIKIQWRQHEIDADVLARIQRDPKVFTKEKVLPSEDEVEETTDNFTGTVSINGSTLFTFKDDTALLSFTITDIDGENYPVNDSKLTWYINGDPQSIKNNVYEISESQLIDREVNIIRAVYNDDDVKVSDDITILKYLGYNSSSIGDGGTDPEDDPEVVGGIIKDNPMIDVIASNGFEVGRTIKFYWKGSKASFVAWRVGDVGSVEKGHFEWIPTDTGIYVVRAVPYSFDGEGGEQRVTLKIVKNSGSSSGGGSNGGGVGDDQFGDDDRVIRIK